MFMIETNTYQGDFDEIFTDSPVMARTIAKALALKARADNTAKNDNSIYTIVVSESNGNRFYAFADWTLKEGWTRYELGEAPTLRETIAERSPSTY